MEKRVFYIEFWKDFIEEKEMIMIAGPRQSGKTTISKLITQNKNNIYFNYDIAADRSKMLQNPYFFQEINLLNIIIVFLLQSHRF